MAYGRMFVTNQALPSLVFPALSALAAYVVFGHIYKSGLSGKMRRDYCSSPTVIGLYSLSYTGIPKVDYQLCVMVTSFYALLEPSNLPFNVDLITGIAAIATIPAIEAARRQRHALLAAHVVIVLISQLLSAAVMIPWYWLIFVTTGAANLSRGPHAKIDQAHAEAILFGAAVGYMIPSTAMLMMDNPYYTAFWPSYPLCMLIAQLAHLFFRPSSRYPQSGYRTIQATYILLFLSSAVPHIYFMGTIVAAGDYARFKTLYVPSLAVPDVSSTIQAVVLDMIQWDLIFVFASTILASLWTAKSMSQFFGMIVWFGVASVAFGPGAAIAGVFSWREGMLNAGTEGSAAKVVKKRD